MAARCLLCSGGSVLVDVVACCRLVRATMLAICKVVDVVLCEFFVFGFDGWYQVWCDVELVWQCAKLESVCLV